MENFGTRIRKIRKEKKLTLEKLSKKCGIDRTYISKIESGKIKNPYIPTLEKIANGLLVDVELLYPFNNLTRLSSQVGLIQSADYDISQNGEILSLLERLQSLKQTDKEVYNRVMTIIQDLLTCVKSAA